MPPCSSIAFGVWGGLFFHSEEFSSFLFIPKLFVIDRLHELCHHPRKMNRLQEEQDEHGHGKWEGKQKGKSDKRITESKARQKKALHCGIVHKPIRLNEGNS
jgi:hypothetical protein